MSKRITSFAIPAILIGSLSALAARAQSVQDAVDGLNQTAAKVTAFKSQTGNTFDSAFIASRAGQIIGVALSFIGVIFLGLMIYAGIMWMTAQGNEQQVTKAKDLILNSVIGVVIVFAAYALTVFIGQNFLQ